MLELRQLRYFVKVAELEHFGQAAGELHVVQPALSRQIKQLEEEIGVELFQRLPRGVRLTSAGRVMLERSRQILNDIEKMVTTTQSAGSGKIGFLKVGFADGATYSGHVPAIIREFRASSPQVELELISASSAAQADLLSQKIIDAGFVYWLPGGTSNVQHHEINHERVVLAVANSNPLARCKSLKLVDLVDAPFIWFKRSNSPMFYDLISTRANAGGLHLNVVQEAFTESTMLSLVAADIGITFITEAAQRRKPDNVVLVDVEDLHADLTLRAMWRADDTEPALRKFVEQIQMV